MYDDYDLDYTFAQDYNLDEDAFYEFYAQLDAQDLDEEYTRDAQDYDTLAYRHYAWCVTRLRTLDYTHKRTSRHMYTHNKRLVTVTLDIICYDDLHLEDVKWRELLELEPGEDIHCKIKEFEVEY